MALDVAGLASVSEAGWHSPRQRAVLNCNHQRVGLRVGCI
jgi:hypothetical protein